MRLLTIPVERRRLLQGIEGEEPSFLSHMVVFSPSDLGRGFYPLLYLFLGERAIKLGGFEDGKRKNGY